MIPEKQRFRKPNMFEYSLLLMGIIAISIGYFFFQTIIERYGINSYEATSVFMLWVLIVILIILTAVSENSKEELKTIIKQQHDELKLLREDMRRKK